MLIQQETPHAPAGLQYAEPHGFRFWVRPDAVRFRRLYAVSVKLQPNGVVTQAFRVVGYMGDYMFDWSVPDHAMSLVVAVGRKSHSLHTFRDIARNYGTEWLLCNADTDSAAVASSDADFVRSWVLSRDRFRSMQGVYFASNGRGSVKIGKTDRCLLTRLRALQLSNPDELRVAAFIATPNATQVEAMLHEKHKATRIRGEWFAMTDDEAVTAAKEFGGGAFDGILG
jgi:hypothetical protein